MRIRICPKCKKAKLRNAINVSGWLAPSMYECLECGYVGNLYFEIDPEDFKDLNLDEKKESNER